jgi:hypothetical protein
MRILDFQTKSIVFLSSGVKFTFVRCRSPRMQKQNKKPRKIGSGIHFNDTLTFSAPYSESTFGVEFSFSHYVPGPNYMESTAACLCACRHH